MAGRAGDVGESEPRRRAQRIWPRLLLAAAVLLAAGLLVWYVVDWRQLLAVLSRADLVLVAAGIAAAVAGIASWGEAMRLLLPEEAKPLSRRRGFLVYATGVLVRNAFPVGYAGSIAVLTYVFRREASLPVDRTLATVSVAELANGVASLTVTAAGVLLIVLVGPPTPLSGWLAAGVLLVVLTGAIAGAVFRFRRSAVERVVRAAGRFLAGAAGLLSGRIQARVTPADVEGALADYFRSLSHVSGRRRAVGLALAYSLLGWSATVAALYAGGLAVGYRIPLGVALVVVPIGGYATALPVPGGLGGYEVGVAGLIHLLGGAELLTALAVTLLFRLCSYWAVIAVGVLASTYLSIDVRAVAAAAVDDQTGGAGGAGGPGGAGTDPPSADR